MRRKEDQVSGVIWDSLPVTEKEKDEIAFQNLNAEVGHIDFDCRLIIITRNVAYGLKLR